MTRLPILLLFLSLLAFSNSTAVANLQLVLSGLAQQVSLPNPTTIGACLDEPTAKTVLDLIARGLKDLASAKISDIDALVADIKAFVDNVPQPVKDCIDSNKEIQTLLEAYGLDLLDTDTMVSKLKSYVLLHPIGFISDVLKLKKSFEAGQFEAFGKGGGALAQKIFPKASITDLTILEVHVDNLQLVLKGLAGQAKLPNPTTIGDCLDETTAKGVMDLIGRALADLAAGKFSDLDALIQAVKDFAAGVPKEIGDCVDTNAEAIALQKAYGIYQADPDVIIAKVKKYILVHPIGFLSDIKAIQRSFDAGKFEDFGKGAGALVQKVLA